MDAAPQNPVPGTPAMGAVMSLCLMSLMPFERSRVNALIKAVAAKNTEGNGGIGIVVYFLHQRYVAVFVDAPWARPGFGQTEFGVLNASANRTVERNANAISQQRLGSWAPASCYQFLNPAWS